MTKLNLFIPLTKVDEERRLVYGTITEEELDKSGEIMDYAMSKPNFQAWSDGFAKATGGRSVGNLRVMHKDVVAGKFTEIQFDDDAKRITGCAKVVDDGEWAKVLDGCYTGFSIGGAYGKVVKEAAGRRYEAKPAEVSLVDNPCLKTATFEVAKADGTVEMRKFAKPGGGRDPSDQSDPGDEDPAKLESKARELCKAAGFDPEEVLTEAVEAEGEDGQAAAAVLKWHGFIEDARRDLVKPGSVELHPGVVQKWAASDGKTFDSKAEAAAYQKSVDAAAAETVAKGITAGAEEQAARIDGILDRLEGKEPEKTVFEKLEGSDRERIGKLTALEGDALAEFVNKASPDLLEAILGKRDFTQAERDKAAKSGDAMEDGSFPIKNKEDLANAVKAYGRAKDKAAAKAHIVKRAKALGATDELPSDWEGSTAKKGAVIGAMRKGMYSVSRLANLLESLSWLRADCKAEREMEGDDSRVPEQLDANIASLGATLKAMVEEEVAELATMGVDPGDMDQITELLACAHETGDLLKVFDASGAMHLALEKAIKAHDEALLAKGSGDGSQATGDGADKLTKAEGDALRTQVTDLTDRLTKMATRLEAMEKLPAPPIGVRRVTKQDDGGGSREAGDGDPVDALSKILDGIPESERSMLMMKAAMRGARVLAE